MTTERETLAWIVHRSTGCGRSKVDPIGDPICYTAADALLAAGVRTGEAVAQDKVRWAIDLQRALDAEAELAEARAVIAAVAALADRREVESKILADQGVGTGYSRITDELRDVLADPAAALAVVKAEAYDKGYDRAMSDAHHVLNQRGYLERRGEDNGNPYRADRDENDV